MAYVDNIVKDAVENQYFVLMRPKRMVLVSEWTVVASTRYSTPFDFGGGKVYAVYDNSNSVELTEAASSTVGSNEFYFDIETKTLYTNNGTFSPSDYSVTFELYLSTKECLWYRDPLDDSTEVVSWVGCIKDPPKLTLVAPLQSFGFVPFEFSDMRCFNDKNIFQKMMYSSSFNRCDVICWHQCGNRDVDNIERLLTGACDGRISYSTTEITFPVADKIADFDELYNYGGVDGSLEYFSQTTFGTSQNMDPSFDGKPIRTVYGRVEGFVPCNVDYNTDAPSTSNNRDWVVGHGQTAAFWDSYSALITGTYSTTGFKIANADAKYFRNGDRIWIDKGTDQWVTISNIIPNGADTTIDTGTVLSGTLVGFSAKKSFVQNIFLLDVENTHWYQLEYGRDYTEANFAQTTRGFTLTSSAEANAGAPTFNPTNHKLFITIQGKQTLPTISGADFETRPNTNGDTNYGAWVKPGIILYDILKTGFGLPEAQIDTAAFQQIDSDFSGIYGFAIPRQWDSEFPSYREVLENMSIGLGKLFFDKDGLMTVRTIAPVTTADADISKEEMFDFNMEFDFTSMTIVSKKLELNEVLLYLTKRALSGLDPAATNFVTKDNEFAVSSAGGLDRIQEIHGITKTTNFELLGELTPDYLQDVYGDRVCSLTFRTKNALVGLYVGDSIAVTRDDLPGFDPGEDNTRNFIISRIEKGDGELLVTLDDQRSIQDNPY
jgi:hypothetical protein